MLKAKLGEGGRHRNRRERERITMLECMILSLFSRMVEILDLAWSMTGSTIDLAEASYLHKAILDILLDGRDNLPDHVAHCGVQPIPTRHKLFNHSPLLASQGAWQNTLVKP